jgi:DNA (cytosine-5)-methyltransferase 1
MIDFFCGAGGFSEGFRQQGFTCLKGYDNWRPAILTHNLNHKLEDSTSDILDFGESGRITPEEIAEDNLDLVPDSEVIVGSPPCVSFSMSNKAGKADKGLGIQLIESYLRVVAVKKHKKKSVLKAWLMENVPNSRNFVKEEYKFSDLGLSKWAKTVGKKPSDLALRVKNNGDVLCAADYGSPQKRDRFVCGEWCATGVFTGAVVTHETHRVLSEIKGKMPSPLLSKRSSKKLSDPNYPKQIKGVSREDLTDHFYDTGVYKIEWRNAKYAKVNHPFMGKMSFPENEKKPSRTIMATRSASTREALIYKSEYSRAGDGEYRTPTIREAATLMGFPWLYQFTGSEGTKWKQIGNAVCPHMSAALATSIRQHMGLKKKRPSFTSLKKVAAVNDLNSGTEKVFNNPPTKKRGGKFRRHMFKTGNMTIALTNYVPGMATKDDGPVDGNWHVMAFLGSGKKYQVQPLCEENRKAAEKLMTTELGQDAALKITSSIRESIHAALAQVNTLDGSPYSFASRKGFVNPFEHIDNLAITIAGMTDKIVLLETPDSDVVNKSLIPLQQVCAVFALCETVKKLDPSAWKKEKGQRPGQGLVQQTPPIA